MTPQRSWTDRLLPDWLTGSGKGGRAVGSEGGSGPEHRALLARIAQQREGLEGSIASLPEEEAEAGRRAREAADELVNRARAAAELLEEGGPEEGYGAAGGGGEDVLAALRRGARALHDAHYRTIRIRVARDHGETSAAAEARDGLPACLEELEEAASALEDLLGRRRPPS